MSGTGLETQKGRLVVDTTLAVPGHPRMFAAGDAAAVPDVTRPGEVTAMTAQHASRQGTLAGRNVAASLGHGTTRGYEHHDLGFVVDLGGLQAAANPLGIPLSGFAAKVVTRGYHLISMPGNRVRTAVDWLLDAVLGPPVRPARADPLGRRAAGHDGSRLDRLSVGTHRSGRRADGVMP